MITAKNESRKSQSFLFNHSAVSFVIAFACFVISTATWASEEKSHFRGTLALTGQFVTNSGSYGATILNQNIEKSYAFTGIRAGLEGGFLARLSQYFFLGGRLGLTFDKLDRLTGSACGVCLDSSNVDTVCDSTDPANASCRASFDNPLVFGVKPAFVAALQLTDWFWIEAGIGVFVGLTQNYEPTVTGQPSIGMGFEYVPCASYGFFLRAELGILLPGTLPKSLAPGLAIGVSF